jgi:2,4-diaminopentanoate dehydrogenase
VKIIRVIQVATGTVGTHSLRTIIGRDDMDLVGLYVFNPGKVGKDAGELIGIGPIGVVATNNFDEILALDADVVSYNALGETLDSDAALNQICRLLESGKNVCSTAVSTHIYPKIVTETPLAEKLQAACEKGGVTFHSSGINPGYMMDVWPIAICRLTRHIETIYMTEMVDMSRYTSTQISEFIGYGKTPEEATFELPQELVLQSSFFASLSMFADATGLEFDRVTINWEGRASGRAVETPAIKTAAGTVDAVRIVLRAYEGSQVRVENQWVWTLGKESCPPEWPYGDGSWSIKVVGDPTIETRIDTATQYDARQPDVLMTGAHAVNAIPKVVAAAAGIATHLDLPLFSGGFFGSIETKSGRL